MLALEFENQEICQKIVQESLNNGIITFYFLFNKRSMRISPPLTIQNSDIIEACGIIIKTINNYYNIK